MIKILKEKPVKYVQLDLDIDDKMYDTLVQAGWEAIQNDRGALAEYALVKALEEFVKHENSRSIA